MDTTRIRTQIANTRIDLKIIEASLNDPAHMAKVSADTINGYHQLRDQLAKRLARQEAKLAAAVTAA